MTIVTLTVVPSPTGPVEVTVEDQGQGRTFLLLHGGAGPQSMAPFAELLAGTRPARTLVPRHPGFGGTSRPDHLASVPALAQLYVALLEQLDLHDVTVVGSSIGGWVAAEMALLASPRVSGFVLMGAVGVDVPEHPPADFFALTLPEVMELSYFNPARFRVDPSSLPPEAQAVMAANRQALAVYSATPDPTLLSRLGGVPRPTLVVWGEADRIATPDYGRAYATAIPGAKFQLLSHTGHMPQLETPDQVVPLVWDFALACSVGSEPVSTPVTTAP